MHRVNLVDVRWRREPWTPVIAYIWCLILMVLALFWWEFGLYVFAWGSQ